MSDDRYIGILDSGLGGLTVVKEIFRIMPHERILYLGDTARSPYGNRSDETIKSYGMQGAAFLLAKNIKLLIVACSTISSVAIEAIRSKINEIPVIGGVLPACKAAVSRTAEKKIGIIGTDAVIRTNIYEKNINALNPNIKVYSKACSLFVPLVEEGMVNNEIAHSVVQYYLYDLVDCGIDCLILGCTHYPLLMEVIQATVSNRIELIDSALWTALEAENILNALESRVSVNTDGFENSYFYITDMLPNIKKIAERYSEKKITAIENIKLEQLSGITI